MKGEIDMALSKGEPECPFLIQRYGNPVASFYKEWKNACKLAGVPGGALSRFPEDGRYQYDRSWPFRKRGDGDQRASHTHVFDRYHIVTEKRLKANAQKLGPVGKVTGKDNHTRFFVSD